MGAGAGLSRAGGGVMGARFFSIRYLALALIFLATAGLAAAQSDRGTIAGTVVDSTGGVVSDAKVVATGVDTGTVYNATTGPTGGYRMPDVRIGAYNVSVTAPGFKTESKTRVCHRNAHRRWRRSWYSGGELRYRYDRGLQADQGSAFGTRCQRPKPPAV